MKTRSATVSILIPVYNARPWVGRAVESALAQTWPDVEIIALDDCSTDGSWDVLQQWKNKIRVEQAEKNGGQNVSRNALTRLSQGEWLVYLDADDELAPDAVALKMAKTESADAIYGTMEVQHFSGDRCTGTKRILAEDYADPLSAAFQWKYPNTSSLMFRRSAVIEVGDWNESIKNCTDYDLYFRLLAAGKHFAAAPESVSVYRQWSESQAVNEDGPRRVRTRLELMWRSALHLEKSGLLKPGVRTAFCDATLESIRVLYPYVPAEAIAEHRRLKNWAPDYTPSPARFPRGFRMAYHWFGFRLAEILAALTRFHRPKPAAALFVPDNAPA